MTYETYLYVLIAAPVFGAFAIGLYRPIDRRLPLVAVLLSSILGVILVTYPYVLTLNMADVTYLMKFGTLEGFSTWLFSFLGLLFLSGVALTSAGVYLATSFFDLGKRLQAPR